MILLKLNVKPGSGLPWWGEATVSCDGEGQWTVITPREDPARGYVEDYLNARYGGRRMLMSYTLLDLIENVVKDLDGEVLRPPPA